MLVSIDPGLHHCGIAVWCNDLLGHASLIKADQTDDHLWVRMAMAARRICRLHQFEDQTLVIEIPQVYRQGVSKGDPNDLIQLVGVAGAIIGTGFQKVVTKLPKEWKGQVPKPTDTKKPYIIAERAKKRLSHKEYDRVLLPTNVRHQWDVWDAIGLGLSHLRRL